MVPARIPRIKQVLRRVTVGEAKEAARQALEMWDSDSVKAIIESRFGERFHHGVTR